VILVGEGFDDDDFDNDNDDDDNDNDNDDDDDEQEVIMCLWVSNPFLLRTSSISIFNF
jgi:hypothetical protein